MSEKFEECSLEEATHVEVNDKVHLLGPNDGHEMRYQVLKYNKYYIRVYMESDGWQLIHIGSFPILGIKPMRERKRKPRQCMALTVIAQRNGKDVVALLPSDDFELGMTVRCVEIVEDEK